VATLESSGQQDITETGQNMTTTRHQYNNTLLIMTIVQQDQQATGLRQKDIDISRKEGQTGQQQKQNIHNHTRSIGY